MSPEPISQLNGCAFAADDLARHLPADVFSRAVRSDVNAWNGPNAGRAAVNPRINLTLKSSTRDNSRLSPPNRMFLLAAASVREVTHTTGVRSPMFAALLFGGLNGFMGQSSSNNDWDVA